MGPILGGFVVAKYTSALTHVLFDGNSLIASPSTTVAQLQALAPVSGALTIDNMGVAGSSVADRISAAPTVVDPTYVMGKQNILIFWEITNSVCNTGRTPTETCADIVAYIVGRQAAVQSAHPGAAPWMVVLVLAIPRGDLIGAGTVASCAADLNTVNSYIRANYRAMGARACVETRVAGGPFAFTDSTNPANFPSTIWRDGGKTHLTPLGESYIAQYIADVLKRFPRR